MNRDLIVKALNKASPYGPDINLEKFELGLPSGETVFSSSVSDTMVERISNRLGFSNNVVKKAGYLQVNESVMIRIMSEKLEKHGAIVLPTKDALKKFEWVKDYSWKLINPDKDKYVAAVYLYGNELGYFIYVPRNTKIKEPIYTCLFMTKNNLAQLLHNIVIVDNDAELNLVTGCGVPDQPLGSLHAGISEFYIGKNAKLTFTMIHAWSPGMFVRPRTTIEVMDGGEFVNYYVIYSSVNSLQTYPQVILRDNSKATLTSVIIGKGESIYDVGSAITLAGKNSSGEILSRNLGRGKSKIYARSRIDGVLGPSKGHIECLGLLEDDTSIINAIPELSSSTPDTILTHEASIGKINEELINYLMSKGFTEDEARAAIIKGFLHVEEPKLPPQVMDTIKRTIEYIVSKATG
ncbi:MAG: SufB/SufD family protein [Thermoprotei archaeon]